MLAGKEFTMDDRAIQVLAEYVGNDLNRLANEIDKVLINTQAANPLQQIW
jgi:DNA polymerase III delta subunit